MVMVWLSELYMVTVMRFCFHLPSNIYSWREGDVMFVTVEHGLHSRRKRLIHSKIYHIMTINQGLYPLAEKMVYPQFCWFFIWRKIPSKMSNDAWPHVWRGGTGGVYLYKYSKKNINVMKKLEIVNFLRGFSIFTIVLMHLIQSYQIPS